MCSDLHIQGDFQDASEADLKLFSPRWDHSMNPIIRNPCHLVNFLNTDFLCPFLRKWNACPFARGPRGSLCASDNIRLYTEPLFMNPVSTQGSEGQSQASSQGNVALGLRLSDSSAVLGECEYYSWRKKCLLKERGVCLFVDYSVWTCSSFFKSGLW